MALDRTDPAIERRARELRAQGKTYDDIAAELSIHRSTVGKILNRPSTDAPAPISAIELLQKQNKILKAQLHKSHGEALQIKKDILNGELVEIKKVSPLVQQYIKIHFHFFLDELPTLITARAAAAKMIEKNIRKIIDKNLKAHFKSAAEKHEARAREALARLS